MDELLAANTNARKAIAELNQALWVLGDRSETDGKGA